MIEKSYGKRKQYHIVVDSSNHERLRNYGKIGETFNEVITRLLENKTKATEILYEEEER